MKLFLLASMLVFASLSAFAQRFSYFENVDQEFCPGKRIDYKNAAVYCKASNPAIVISARVGAAVTSAEYKKLGFTHYSAVDAGIVPDDSSNTVYSFIRWLVDASGRKVGIVTIQGWTNSEMEDSARFDVRYNLKGEVAMASSHTLRK